jgi:hypothetical protein
MVVWGFGGSGGGGWGVFFKELSNKENCVRGGKGKFGRRK